MKKRIYLYYSLVANRYHALFGQCCRACHGQEMVQILYLFHRRIAFNRPTVSKN